MTQQELELPKGWVETKLGDIITSVKGKKPKTLGEKNSKNKIPYITIKAFEKNIFEQFTNDESCPKCTENDLLMVWDGSRSGLVGFGVSGIIGSTLVRLDCYENNSKFLWYFLQSKYQILNTKPRGSGTPHVDPTRLWNFKFLLPSLNEQKRIVTKIEELFSKIDSTKQSLEHTKLQLKLYRQSLLKFTFKKIEDKCESFKLNDLCVKITDGTHKTPKYKKSGIPFLSAKDVRNGKISFEDCKFISQEAHNELIKRCNPEFDDIIITKSGTIGRIAIIDVKKSFSLFESAALIKPLKNINRKYLEYTFQNFFNHTSISQQMKGVAVKHFHLEDIREMKILLPSIEEQEQIVSKIEQGFSLIQNSQRIVNSTLQTLETMRMSVLKQAFEGNLVPQDPNEEPASILLEKIKKSQVDLKPKLGRAKNVK